MSKQNKSDGDAAYGGYRAGFSVLVGRPNAGKSTLTNALVGQKVAITSAKPADHAPHNPWHRAPGRRPVDPR